MIDDERFSYEMNEGALAHPLMPFRITRLVLCLRWVIDSTGEKGERAFLAWCAARNEQDRLDAYDRAESRK